MSDHEPKVQPRIYRDWVLWAAILLAVIPIARWAITSRNPCSAPPSYYPTPYYDPVNYPELIERHSTRSCSYLLELTIAVPVASLLLLMFSKGRRRITVPAVIVAFTSTCGLLFLGFVSFIQDGATLTEKGSAEFEGRLYHLTQADVIAGGMDVSYTSFILHECELDDTNCYGRELNDYGSPAYENPSLVLNEDANQLEVWADGEVVFTLSAGTIPLPEGYADLPVITAENAGSLREIAALATDSIQELVWSPDGEVLAGVNGTRLWLHTFGQETITIDLSNLPIEADGIVFVSDAERIFIPRDLQDSITIWDAEDEKLLEQAIVSHSNNVALSSDGRMVTLVCCSNSGNNHFYGLYDPIARHHLGAVGNIYWALDAFAFSPTKDLFAFSGYEYYDGGEGSSYLRIWDLEEKTEISYLHGYEVGQFQDIEFTPDGRLLVFSAQVLRDPDDHFGESDTFLYAWSIEEQATVYEVRLPDRTGSIASLSISPDGTLIATATGDGLIRVWAVKSGELIAEIRAQEEIEYGWAYITAVAFSPNGNVLASSGADNHVRLWGVVK